MKSSGTRKRRHCFLCVEQRGVPRWHLLFILGFSLTTGVSDQESLREEESSEKLFQYSGHYFFCEEVGLFFFFAHDGPVKEGVHL